MATQADTMAAYFRSVDYFPFKEQWDYHKSPARFRIATAGRRFGKSTMAARDCVPKYLLKPNKTVWAIGPCVDEETVILTQRGWLRVDEVREGDETLSVNPITGLSEWNIIEKVLRKQGVHDVIRMEGDSFSSVSTPDHRWLTNRHPGLVYKKGESKLPKLPKVLQSVSHLLPRTANGWTWRTTATLTADDRIPRAATCSSIPATAKYTDAFVELIAWIWTEDSLAREERPTQTAFVIHQSHVTDAPNCDRIRCALIAMNASYTEAVCPSQPRMTHFELNTEISVELWQVFSSHKVVRPEFIRSLTVAQLDLFVRISILGDSNVTSRKVYQCSQEQLFAVQLACSLLGVPTSLHGEEGRWYLSLLSNRFVNPKRAVYNVDPEGMKITTEQYEGTVWCVTTHNGNWLASRSGTVYYTANTYDLAEKEFRVIWQDLIVKKKLGRDKRVRKAYNKKQGDMRIELPWGTRIECRSADHADLLIGEALDHAIMCEAAKHKKETWDRFIRPSLSDRRGSADFPTCFVADTLVVTEDGIVELGDISSERVPGTYVPYGRKVAGFVGEHQVATRFYVNGVWPTKRIHTHGGFEVEGTLNHPVWAKRAKDLYKGSLANCHGHVQGDWVCLEDLKIGDYVAVRIGADLWGRSGEDLTEFTYPVHEDQAQFSVPMTMEPDLAYLMGLIVGDGCIHSGSSGCESVTVSFDQKIDTEIGNFLESKPYGLIFEQERPYAWRCNNTRFVQFLLWYGFERSSDARAPAKVLPKRLLQCSPMLIAHALSGLYDADATVRSKGGVNLDSTSKRLLVQVQTVLANMGIVATLGNKVVNKATRLCKESTKYALTCEGFEARLWYEQVGFRLSRKQTLQSRLPMASRRRWSTEYYWAKVDSIVDGEAETFDLSVPTTHALTGNSIVLKNTPEGFNFLYELWQLGRNPDFPDYKSWRFPSWMNTHIYPGGRQDPEILLLEKTMDIEWFMQEIGADFASFVGKIFPDWDEFVHVRPHTFNPLWKNYITFDWGYTNYMSAVEFQVSPSDQIHIWRVWYKKYKTISDMVAELKAQERPEGYHISLCFGDPADPEAVEMVTRELNRDEPEDSPYRGVACFAPKNLKTDYSWLDGIMLMRQFMKTDRELPSIDEYGTPEYEPSYFVDPRCTDVTREHSNYRSKEAIKGRNVPELGNKVDDHTIDAIRYALLCIFKVGVQYHLEDVMDLNASAPSSNRREVVRSSSGLIVASSTNGLAGAGDELLRVSDSNIEAFFNESAGTFTRDMVF